MKNLEGSKHFASPRLAGEALATANNGNQQAMPVNASSDVNFDILADYRPVPLNQEHGQKHEKEQAKGGAR